MDRGRQGARRVGGGGARGDDQSKQPSLDDGKSAEPSEPDNSSEAVDEFANPTPYTRSRAPAVGRPLGVGVEFPLAGKQLVLARLERSEVTDVRATILARSAQSGADWTEK